MQNTQKSNSDSTGLQLAIVEPSPSSSDQGQLNINRPINAFTDREVDFFYSLYRNGRVQLAVGQRHFTRYTALEDFIFETRRSSGVIEAYNSIESILNVENSERAELMRNWLCNVAPSCVFRHRSTEFGQTSFFRCCFANCATPVSSQFALIRHYREQHYSQMPPGIFGTLVIFNCAACGVSFKREEHLNQHFSSLGHITQMALRGSDRSRRHLAALEQSRQFADRVLTVQKEKRLSNEEDLFYSNIAASTIPSSNHLAIESNRNRLAITSGLQDVCSSNPIVVEANSKSQSIVNRQEHSSSGKQSQASNPSHENDDDDQELSQRTISQLNINDEQSNNDEDSESNDDEQPKCSVNVKDFNMTHLVDYTDATPKSPPSRTRVKRSLYDDDENQSQNDSRESLPVKRGKCDESSDYAEYLRDIQIPGWLTKSREESSLKKAHQGSAILTSKTGQVFTTISSAKTIARDAPKQNKANQSDEKSGFCIKCDNEITWKQCTGYNNAANRGRLWYKCPQCFWFQWQDKL